MKKFSLAIAIMMVPGAALAASDTSAEIAANKAAMETMHGKMMVEYSGDADKDFVRGMVPHHQGAIDMAKVELQYGKDPEIRKLAEGIIAAQEKEIKQMQNWQKSHDTTAK